MSLLLHKTILEHLNLVGATFVLIYKLVVIFLTYGSIKLFIYYSSWSNFCINLVLEYLVILSYGSIKLDINIVGATFVLILYLVMLFIIWLYKIYIDLVLNDTVYIIFTIFCLIFIKYMLLHCYYTVGWTLFEFEHVP